MESRDYVLDTLRRYIIPFFDGLPDGHDSGHLVRVARLVEHLCAKEGADPFCAALIAWLHELGDDKITAPGLIRDPEELLRRLGLLEKISPNVLENVCDSVSKISFRGSGKSVPVSLEGMIAQDADRLDALGFVGIARLFAYSGAHGNVIYDAGQGIVDIKNFNEYRGSGRDAMNHFHEKIFRLKELMNTETARCIAERRHKVCEEFVEGFLKEARGGDFE